MSHPRNATGKRKAPDEDGPAPCEDSISTSELADTEDAGTTSSDNLSAPIQDVQLNVGPSLDKKEFISWAKVDSYLEQYQAQSFQAFRVRTNKTAEARNTIIARDKSKSLPIPLEWKHYAKTFACTHAGKYKPRGQGKRPRQESRALECKAQINICVQPKYVEGVLTFMARVTKSKLIHNHPIDRHTYHQYPSARLAIPDEVMATVDVLQRAGVKNNRIMKYIREQSSCKPQNRDVRNIVNRLKAREANSSTVGERLHKWMQEFSEEPENIGRIFVDVVNQKTRAMRGMFQRFPEVLLIDATHGTNVSKYKVFSFMAHDAFGHGQYVQHAVVQNERYETLLTAIETFKKHNPAWTNVRSIVIDKDFTELSVLKQAFPDAAILLCQFHVIKYLHEEIACADYGFTSLQKDQIRAAVHLLVYAKSERVYEKYRRYMRKLMHVGSTAAESTVETVANASPSQANPLEGMEELESELLDEHLNDRPTHPFEEYFSRNWDNCREMWCSYKRGNITTLGNNTNNRLESSWKQLKGIVNSGMKVDECVAAIMCYQNQLEEDFTASVFKLSVVHHAEYDTEMSHLAKLVSDHACGLISKQYKFTLTRARYRHYEALPGIYFIKNELEADDGLDELAAEYCVDRNQWSCSCNFMMTHLLPCRHIFYIRKYLGMETVIPLQHLNERWLLSTLRAPCNLPDINERPFGVSSILPRGRTPWDSNRKYREAKEASSVLCNLMSEFGMPDYQKTLNALNSFTKLIKNGKISAVEEVLTATLSAELPPVESTTQQIDFTESTIEETYDETDTTDVAHAEHEIVGEPHVGQEIAGEPHVGHEITSEGHGDHEINSEPNVESESNHALRAERSNTTEPVKPATEPIVQPIQTCVSRTMQASGNHLERNNVVPTVEFDVESPPRPKGRPRLTAKARQTKRSIAINIATEDSDMYERQLSLSDVSNTLNGEPSYESAAFFRDFRKYVFAERPKAPTAYLLSKLPPGKTLLNPNDLVRVLPRELLTRCQNKTTAFQTKRKGNAEPEIALEIHGVGVFAATTLTLMRKWYTVVDALNLIDKTTAWVKTIDFELELPANFSTREDIDLPRRVKQLIPLSTDMEFLYVARKGTLGDKVMQTITAKLFGNNPSVIVLDCARFGAIIDGINVEEIQTVLYGVSDEKVLIPINCNGNHWCSIMIDFGNALLYYYDPMASSYAMKLRVLATKLKSVIQVVDDRRIRVQPLTTSMGIQVDSYNCGVYNLLAFEMFVSPGAEQLGHLSSKMLQYLRYRYILLCV